MNSQLQNLQVWDGLVFLRGMNVVTKLLVRRLEMRLYWYENMPRFDARSGMDSQFNFSFSLPVQIRSSEERAEILIHYTLERTLPREWLAPAALRVHESRGRKYCAMQELRRLNRVSGQNWKIYRFLPNATTNKHSTLGRIISFVAGRLIDRKHAPDR